jgi:hypothetical protein
VGPSDIIKIDYNYQMELTPKEDIPPAMLQNPVQPVQPQSIISISDILNAIDVIQSQENIDKGLVETLITVNETDLRNRLIAWGMSGFLSGYVLYSLQFGRLEKCSDGITRNDLVDYISFLFPNTTLATILQTIESKLPGMTLSYSYTNDFILRVHVSQK